MTHVCSNKQASERPTVAVEQFGLESMRSLSSALVTLQRVGSASPQANKPGSCYRVQTRLVISLVVLALSGSVARA
jgi:hypothetical protein